MHLLFLTLEIFLVFLKLVTKWFPNLIWICLELWLRICMISGWMDEECMHM